MPDRGGATAGEDVETPFRPTLKRSREQVSSRGEFVTCQRSPRYGGSTSAEHRDGVRQPFSNYRSVYDDGAGPCTNRSRLLGPVKERPLSEALSNKRAEVQNVTLRAAV